MLGGFTYLNTIFDDRISILQNKKPIKQSRPADIFYQTPGKVFKKKDHVPPLRLRPFRLPSIIFPNLTQSVPSGCSSFWFPFDSPLNYTDVRRVLFLKKRPIHFCLLPPYTFTNNNFVQLRLRFFTLHETRFY